MDNYNLLSKRKSVRSFDKEKNIDLDTFDKINNCFSSLIPLFPKIKIEFEIVKKELTSCSRGEYCIIMYSEKKDGYLYNAGYILEQLELYLIKLNIGVCYYGFGRSKVKSESDLSLVTMLNIGIPKENLFRTSLKEFDRFPLEKTWEGNLIENVSALASLAPSACNSQPWRITNKENILTVTRSKNFLSKLAFKLGEYFNLVDIGIYLYFLELCLTKENYSFIREYKDDFFTYIYRKN